MTDMDCIIDELLEKDLWIQKAKALLFDCQHSLDSKQLIQECKRLVIDGGGYNYELESAKTVLVWKPRE